MEHNKRPMRGSESGSEASGPDPDCKAFKERVRAARTDPFAKPLYGLPHPCVPAHFPPARGFPCFAVERFRYRP